MLFRYDMVVKFLLKVVTDTVPELELPEVVVVDDELLLPQAATRSPLATTIVATMRLRVSLTVDPLCSICARRRQTWKPGSGSDVTAM
jgi:hypothetical protein